jgi:RNA polymerase sigma factor (TIGR02999 family)
MAAITDLLQSLNAGDAQASGKLFGLMYPELKHLAHRCLSRSGGGRDLDTTSLVHESFLRLRERQQLEAADRWAFFSYVGRVMRSVVIDHVRARHAQKRGGNLVPVTLSVVAGGETFDDTQLLAMNEALITLQRIAPEYHQLVELRYFAGLSVREIADLQGQSTRTVTRDWQKARAFLRRLMIEGEAELSDPER